MIEVAHVWPKTYPSLEEGREKTCCYWFVGLEIKSEVSGSLSVTMPIKQFTEQVMRSATAIGVWKEGMKVDANYRKRKQLASLLPVSERHKLKQGRNSVSSPSLASLAAASPSTTPAAALPAPSPQATSERLQANAQESGDSTQAAESPAGEERK